MLGVMFSFAQKMGAKYRRSTIEGLLEGARTKREVIEVKIGVKHFTNPGTNERPADPPESLNPNFLGSPTSAQTT